MNNRVWIGKLSPYIRCTIVKKCKKKTVMSCHLKNQISRKISCTRTSNIAHIIGYHVIFISWCITNRVTYFYTGNVLSVLRFTYCTILKRMEPVETKSLNITTKNVWVDEGCCRSLLLLNLQPTFTFKTKGGYIQSCMVYGVTYFITGIMSLFSSKIGTKSTTG